MAEQSSRAQTRAKPPALAAFLLGIGYESAQAIDFPGFVLHIELQIGQWRAAPSRITLFYNGPVVTGVNQTDTLQEAQAHFPSDRRRARLQ
ncbi:hypothetical protein [Caballeronia sp. TF1N1]|uniref:hypothetical protein n=1 Tax=Caballeronia sp. TF1N1 TaxID=2878153 RepID=UPI001FD603E3|nr:hypothetical protein [Caballeronia sp. TF1N1]